MTAKSGCFHPVQHHDPSDVPKMSENFVDRTGLQKQVLAALLGGAASPTVTITSSRHGASPHKSFSTHVQGHGGVGKTALAVWVVQHKPVAKYYPCRFWVQLNQEPDLEAAVQILYADATGGGAMELRQKDEKDVNLKVIMARGSS